MTVYISGGITNVPDFKERFKKAEKHLTELGFNVINPAGLQGNVMQGEFKHAEYMEICISLLNLSDCVYLLDGWQNSKGVRRELRIACIFGKPVISEQEERERYKSIWARFN